MIFDLQIRAQPHAQSLFLFPIVFGINLILFFDEKDGAAGYSIICFGAVRFAGFFITRRAKLSLPLPSADFARETVCMSLHHLEVKPMLPNL